MQFEQLPLPVEITPASEHVQFEHMPVTTEAGSPGCGHTCHGATWLETPLASHAHDVQLPVVL